MTLKSSLDILKREITLGNKLTDEERFTKLKEIVLDILMAKVRPLEDRLKPPKSLFMKLLKKWKKIDSKGSVSLSDTLWTLVKDYLGFLCSVIQHIVNEVDDVSESEDDLIAQMELIRDLQSEAVDLREKLETLPQDKDLFSQIKDGFLAEKVIKLILALAKDVGVKEDLENHISEYFDGETPFEISSPY